MAITKFGWVRQMIVSNRTDSQVFSI